MLVRHDVFFVFWIGRLVLRGHVDGFVGEVGRAVEFLCWCLVGEGAVGGVGLRGGQGREGEGRGGKGGEGKKGIRKGRKGREEKGGEIYLKEISVPGLVGVDIRIRGVFRLDMGNQLTHYHNQRERERRGGRGGRGSLPS